MQDQSKISDQIWTNIWAGGLQILLQSSNSLHTYIYSFFLDVKESEMRKWKILPELQFPHTRLLQWAGKCDGVISKNKDAGKDFHIVSTFVFPAIKGMKYGQLPDFDSSRGK